MNTQKELLRRLLKRVIYGYTEEEVPKEVYKEIDKIKWMQKVTKPTYMKAWLGATTFLKYGIFAFVINLLIKGTLTLEWIMSRSFYTAGFFFVGFLIFITAKRMT